MKSNTHIKKTVHLPGQELLLESASNLVLYASSGNAHEIWNRDEIEVDGDAIKFDMSAAQTTDLVGLCAFELTITVGEYTEKTETWYEYIEKSLN